jgi:uncharacterized protein YegP (UPF0339 family)
MAKGKTGFQVYQDRGKQWRWRVVARNGRLVADSGEGYRRRASALNGARTARRALASTQ